MTWEKIVETALLVLSALLAAFRVFKDADVVHA